MEVCLIQSYAGSRGCFGPGDIIDVTEKEAAELFSADPVAARQPTAEDRVRWHKKMSRGKYVDHDRLAEIVFDLVDRVTILEKEKE